MKILILDGYNLIHRARWSPAAKRGGDHGTTYSFARSLKVLIEKFMPDKAYFVLEGYPKKRHDLVDDYKGNRAPIIDESFHRQKKDIIELCRDYLPTTVIRHPDYECDDTIAYLARYRHSKEECVIVSTDTDFIQILQTSKNVKLYNPIKKSFVSFPEYDYISWKALRGDSADNVHGFQGIGDKRAATLVKNPNQLAEFLMKSEENLKKYTKNLFLISLHDYLLKEEAEKMEEFDSKFDWNNCRKFFVDRDFKSMVNNKYAINFKQIFENLETGWKI